MRWSVTILQQFVRGTNIVVVLRECLNTVRDRACVGYR